jgi:ribosomal protein L32
VLECEFTRNRTPPGLRAQFATKVVGVVCVCSNFNSLKIDHRLARECDSQPRLQVCVCVCSNLNSLKIEHRLASSSMVISGATKALVPAAPAPAASRSHHAASTSARPTRRRKCTAFQSGFFAKAPACCRPVAIAHRAWGVGAVRRVIRHERAHSCSRLDILRGGVVVCRKQRVRGRQNGRAQCAFSTRGRLAADGRVGAARHEKARCPHTQVPVVRLYPRFYFGRKALIKASAQN